MKKNLSNNYSPEEREAWINSIYPEIKNQKWHLNQVFHPSHIKHIDFFKQTSKNKVCINPQKICGIEYAYSYNYPQYGNTINWKYMLHWLKRLDWVINNFETLEKIVKHIHENPEPKIVHQYGDHYFTVGGQHRLCLAKYLDIKEVWVDVYKFELDRALFVRERKFERYIHKLKEYGMISEDFENTINQHSVDLKINNTEFCVDKKFVEFIIIRYDLLISKPLKAFPGSLKVIFKGYSNLIKKESDLRDLDFFLRRHFLQVKRAS